MSENGAWRLALGGVRKLDWLTFLTQSCPSEEEIKGEREWKTVLGAWRLAGQKAPLADIL